MRSLDIASTGMMAQQTNVEVIANNLANMNTTGFKQQRAEFQDLLYQNVEQAGAQTSDSGTVLPMGIQLGSGVRTAAVSRIMTQGDLSNTGNPYDLAIMGSGYFHITMPDGTDAYTRAGNFALSPEGQIVTDKGYTVAPGIAVPATALSIAVNAQGQVQATMPGQTAPQTLGQLELVRFPNEGGLSAQGDNLFTETQSSGSAQAGVPGSTGYGTIQQNYLETANVNPVEEVTALITAQRAYEMNSKVVTAADDMMQTTSRMGRFMMIIRSLAVAFAVLALPFFANMALANGVADMRIVVPSHSIPRGTTISDSDLLYQTVTPDSVQAGIVTSMNDLDGMKLRRTLRAGEPVRPDDVRKPILVTKGSTVTIVFNAPGITLTAVGKAMGEGGMGEAVTVLNPISYRQITCTVSGAGAVRAGDTSTTITQIASLQK